AQLFCPPRVAEFLAMATSHSLIVPAALAMVLPSAVIARPRSHPGPPTLKVTRSFGSRADEEEPSCFVSFFGSVLAAASLRGSAADTQATTKIISNGVFIGTPGKKLTGRDTAGADATYRVSGIQATSSREPPFGSTGGSVLALQVSLAMFHQILQE